MAKGTNESVFLKRGETINGTGFDAGDVLGSVNAQGEVVSVAEGITRGHVEARLNGGRAWSRSQRDAAEETERMASKPAGGQGEGNDNGGDGESSGN